MPYPLPSFSSCFLNESAGIGIRYTTFFHFLYFSSISSICRICCPHFLPISQPSFKKQLILQLLYVRAKICVLYFSLEYTFEVVFNAHFVFCCRLHDFMLHDLLHLLEALILLLIYRILFWPTPILSKY